MGGAGDGILGLARAGVGGWAGSAGVVALEDQAAIMATGARLAPEILKTLDPAGKVAEPILG
jgi:hypothetical protein